jgi:hypothetical protein
MRLTIRAQKTCYMSVTCLCIAGALSIVIWATRPLDVTSSRTLDPTAAIQALGTLSRETRGPARADFAKLCERPLRRALYDPQPPKLEVRQLPPLRLELLGTIIEESNSMAIVRSEQGSTQYKRIGDAIGPADSPANVVEITANSIIMERGKERITLKVQSKELR